MKRVLLGTAGLLLAGVAQSAILDFEAFASGTIIDNEYSALGITISVDNTAGGPDLGVVFDTENPTGGDTDLAGPFSSDGLGQLSPGKVLIIQENGPCSATSCDTPDDEGGRAAGSITISFGGPITLETIDFFDVETPEAGPGEDNRITLFDVNGAAIALDFFTPDTGGDNRWDQVFFGISGVTAIQINMGGSGAIDNIAFQPVPVPAAFPLLITALAGLGFLRRRK